MPVDGKRPESRSGNPRASLSMALGLVAVASLPFAIYVTRKLPGAELLDAAWAIPFAFLCGVAALLFGRGARGTIAWTLDRAGGRARIRTSRILAVAGISIALSASIAVGFYELLLRLES